MLQRIDGDTGVPLPGEGLYFRMRWGRRTVRFFATTEFLASVAGQDVLDERAAFLACRDEIESLAIARYFGDGENDDGVVELGSRRADPPAIDRVAA